MERIKKRLRLKDFNALVFTLCVVLSTIFWFLTQLSDSQKSYTPFEVEYINLPKGLVITNELPNKIDVELESQGFQLLKYELNFSSEKLAIDLSKVKFRGNEFDKNGVLLTDFSIADFEGQLKNQVEINSVSPDTIFFSLSKSMEKKLAVKPIIQVDMGEGYDLVGVSPSPDSVLVKGSYHFFNENKDLKVLVDSLPEFTDSVNYVMDVLLPHGVTISDKNLKVLINKENVLKQSMTVPVKVINAPIGKELQLFPNKVNVSFYSSNSVRERLSSSSFNFVVDYNEIMGRDNVSRISVQPYLIPDGVQNVKVSPGKLEFIKKR